MSMVDSWATCPASTVFELGRAVGSGDTALPPLDGARDGWPLVGGRVGSAGTCRPAPPRVRMVVAFIDQPRRWR